MAEAKQGKTGSTDLKARVNYWGDENYSANLLSFITMDRGFIPLMEKRRSCCRREKQF